MAESVAKGHADISSAHRRWLLVGAAIGRVGRWIVFGVIVAAVPTAISLFFLPGNSSPDSVLSHGDFAVLATAISGAAIGELMGPDEPPRWLRNILFSSCFLVLLAAIVLLGAIAHEPDSLSAQKYTPWWQLTAQQKVSYSWLLFIIATVAGAASMALTIQRPLHLPSKANSPSSEDSSPAEGGDAS